MENASSASTKFGLDLFRIVCDKDPTANGFISPLSLSVALSMTQLGAGGETAKGMAKALRWEEGKETAIHEENQKYISMIQEGNKEYILSIANRLFVQHGYALLPEFLQQTQKLYLAQAQPCHFDSNAEEERVKINTWVEEQTKERIKDLLAEGVLNEDTRMVLVNAVYFKGKWTKPFNADDTHQIPFKVSPTSTKKVSTMTCEESLSFWLDDGSEGFSALELPYKGDGLSMVILLPKDDFGLAEMEKNLTHEKLTSIFSRLRRPENIKVQLPKFEMTCDYQMREPLSRLGMAVAFNRFKADFSQMTHTNDVSGNVHKARTNDLYVSEVVHKSFVNVAEEGSEAAAVTNVNVFLAECCIDDIPFDLPEFFVDHPFLFVIRDQRAFNSILFMGKVADPLSRSSSSLSSNSNIPTDSVNRA